MGANRAKMISTGLKIMVGLSVALFCVSAVAQDSKLEAKIKRKIFDDCDKAEADAANLSDRDKRDLVPYLGRVLELKLEAETSLAAEATKIGRQPGLAAAVNPDGNELWRTFDPDHERQAKQCALKILARGDRTAIGEIDKVIAFALTYHETGAEEEFEEALVLARQIVQAGRNEVSPDLERQGLLELLELRAETRSALIDEFILELAKSYPDILADELFNSSHERRLYSVRLFSRLSIDDIPTGEQIVRYFNAASDLQRREMAAVLAAYEADSIRVRFVHELISQLAQGVELDGELANSFTYAVRSLPKESFRQLMDEDKANLQQLFLTGKHAILFQPMVSKLLEINLLSQDLLRQGLRSENLETRKVSLRLIDELVEGRRDYFDDLKLLAATADADDRPIISGLIVVSDVPNGKKSELFSQLIFEWAKLPVDSRPNGSAICAADAMLKTDPSPRLLGRVVSLFYTPVEAALKSNPNGLPPGLREQVQVIGMIGARSFKLIPKALAESKLPEVQESLLKGIAGQDNLDPRVIVYLKQLNKRGALPEGLLKLFPESLKANIVTNYTALGKN